MTLSVVEGLGWEGGGPLFVALLVLFTDILMLLMMMMERRNCQNWVMKVLFHQVLHGNHFKHEFFHHQARSQYTELSEMKIFL